MRHEKGIPERPPAGQGLGLQAANPSLCDDLWAHPPQMRLRNLRHTRELREIPGLAGPSQIPQGDPKETLGILEAMVLPTPSAETHSIVLYGFCDPRHEDPGDPEHDKEIPEGPQPRWEGGVPEGPWAGLRDYGSPLSPQCGESTGPVT